MEGVGVHWWVGKTRDSMTSFGKEANWAVSEETNSWTLATSNWVSGL